jgi:hypothetical protein
VKASTREERDERRRARARAIRRRRLVTLVAVAAALIAAGLAIAQSTRDEPAAKSRASAQDCVAKVKVAGPTWLSGRRATVLVDSVLLGGVPSVRSDLRAWRVDVLGRAAVTVRLIEEKIREAGMRIAPLAIVGVGYNSLWERKRRNYAKWVREFDRHAARLVRTLRRQGAEQIVWVTLRDARRSVIPSNSLWQFDKYSWYFPYVNERLRLLDERSRHVVLADWAEVSNKRGLTYDAIHLDPDGQALMARTIRKAFVGEATRQQEVARDAAVTACKKKAG